MADYIIADAKSGRLSFRRPFPAELRPFVPGERRELKVSLRGTSLKQPDVLDRYKAALSDYERIVEQARRRERQEYHPLDESTIALLAEGLRAESLREDEEARWDPNERALFRSVAESLKAAGVAFRSPWLGREGERWSSKTKETVEASVTKWRRLRAQGDLEGILAEWKDQAADEGETRGLAINPADTEGMLKLCRALNDAAIAAGEDRLRRLAGEDVPTPPEPQVTTVQASSAAKAALPIMATFDDYAVHMTPGVRTDLRRNVQRLVDFVSHDDARRLTTEDIMRWRDALAAEVGRGGKLRDPVTIKGKYVGAVKAMLNWAVQEMKLPVNVAAPVVVKVPKKPRLRQPDFTTEEALKILAATLKPAPEKMAQGHALARRWIPWLCAYTGARVNEFSQLRGEDVKKVDGVWTVRITPEAGAVKTKEARIVPLHSHLIEQGFIAAVEGKGAAPIFYDPKATRKAKDGNRHFKKVGERLAEWVRNEVGVDDPAIKPNHAWRHLFKTRAFAAGMQERIADAIQGHTAANVSRGYGSIAVATMAEAIETLPRFEVAEVGLPRGED